MKNIKTSVYSYNGEEKQFKFKTSLSAYDKIKFVNNVTKLVVDDNYYSMLKDLFFDFVIIDTFTDVSILDEDDKKAEYTVDIVESLVSGTDIVDIVKANADYGVIEELKKAVDDNIEYKTGIHKNQFAPLINSLSSLLNTVEDKLSTIDVDSMMEMAQIISGMTGELTPEKMLDAYSKSDMFKLKQEQLIANKKQHNNKIDKLKEDLKLS